MNFAFIHPDAENLLRIFADRILNKL